MKRSTVLALTFCMAVIGMALFGSTPAVFAQKAQKTAIGGVDKTHLQKVWDGWAALDPAAQKQYYAQGPHVFFDIAPLKYSSWDDYQSGVTQELADFKAAHFTLDDDVQIHKSGDAYWVTATVAYDMTHKAGKRDMGKFRWTAIFEKIDGKWLIVHEHVSEPAS